MMVRGLGSPPAAALKAEVQPMRQAAAGRLPARRRRLPAGLLANAAVLCAVLALWVLASALGWVGGGRFPSVSEALQALGQIARTGYADGLLLAHAAHSVQLVAMGFLLASGIGVALGIAMGMSRSVDAMLGPVFSLLRPIPPLAWIPLAILWLGLGDGAKIMVICLAALVPAVVATHTGVRQIDRPVLEAACMMGTPLWRGIAEVVVPAASPMIFTGLRLALQTSWAALVAAELVGAFLGLGRVLNVAQQDIFPAMILVGMAAVAVCGWLTSRLLEAVEKRLLAWHASTRDA